MEEIGGFLMKEGLRVQWEFPNIHGANECGTPCVSAQMVIVPCCVQALLHGYDVLDILCAKTFHGYSLLYPYKKGGGEVQRG